MAESSTLFSTHQIISSCEYFEICIDLFYDRQLSTSEILHGLPDWKLPISGTIPIRDLNPFRKAVEYFTGTELSVIEQVDTNFKVFARGYYLMGTE